MVDWFTQLFNFFILKLCEHKWSVCNGGTSFPRKGSDFVLCLYERLLMMKLKDAKERKVIVENCVCK